VANEPDPGGASANRERGEGVARIFLRLIADPSCAKMCAKVWPTETGVVEMEAAGSKLEMTPGSAVERVEGGLGLGRGELAGALGVSTRTVERWRAGLTYPQHEARERLAELVAVEGHLEETFGDPESGRAWLRSGNPYLGGLTPVEVMRAGRADRVEAALEALDSGVFI
jgi:uncharacterized protein (DUF2384 family)